MSLRPVIVGEATSTIRLTKGFETVVSNDKLHLVKDYNWYTMICRSKPYAVRHATPAEGGNGKHVYLHRVILQCPEGYEGDHRDGNTLNNTNENLRIATHFQNQHNRRLQKTNTSGVHGVSFDKQLGKFRAQIHLNGKQIYLGCFSNIEDARAARLAAKPIYHGEFGKE